MSRPDNREGIRAAARALFGAHGYHEVTVRDIAAAAGVSPALVIKLHGSKAELYMEVGPVRLPLTELAVPRERLGAAMVRQILVRREQGLVEPWARMPLSVRESPQPEHTRAELHSKVLVGIAELIGDGTPDRRHATAVACQLIGLAEGLRVIGFFPPDQTPAAELLGLYAPLVQHQIDACAPGRPR